MRKLLACLLFVAGALSGLPSFGQDETRIRSDAGGIYQSPAFGQGSVTGFSSAVVILRDAAGNQLDSRTVNAWANLILPAIFPPPPNPVVGTLTTSGGQVTIRFDYSVLSKWYPSLPGGTVEIVHNGSLIDRDRLYR